MKNMNENITMMDRVKMKMAEATADILTKQAEMGTRHSDTFFISEPVFPIELLKEIQNEKSQI